MTVHQPLTDQQLDEIYAAVAATFDEHETPERRQSRWEAAAHAAGREVDRNVLRAYMAVADAEQRAIADRWATSVAASDAEVRRLRAELATARTQIADEVIEWSGRQVGIHVPTVDAIANMLHPAPAAVVSSAAGTPGSAR